jgi:hypothetical protein
MSTGSIFPLLLSGELSADVNPGESNAIILVFSRRFRLDLGGYERLAEGHYKPWGVEPNNFSVFKAFQT